MSSSTTELNTPNIKAADQASCGCQNCGCHTPLPEKGFLARVFKPLANVGGGGAIGFLAGHAGCCLTPALVAITGLSTSMTGGMSVVAFAFGAAATAGGVYVWHRLRGTKASQTEKAIVIGSAVTGLAISGFMHLSHAHHNHAQQTQAPTHAYDWRTDGYCGMLPPQTRPAP